MNFFTYLFASGPATGDWIGHYEQHGRTFPVELSLRHRRKQVSGRMVDVDGTHAQPLKQLLMDSQMPAGQIEEFVEEIRSQFPDSASGEIEYHSSLPTNSLIAGEIDGFSISLTKRYEGYMEIEYRLNGLSLIQDAQCETVIYNGTISEDFNQISGNWSISVPDDHLAELSGRFELERKRAG